MMYPGSEKFEFAYTVGDKIFVYGEAYRIHSVTIDALLNKGILFRERQKDG